MCSPSVDTFCVDRLVLNMEQQTNHKDNIWNHISRLTYAIQCCGVYVPMKLKKKRDQVIMIIYSCIILIFNLLTVGSDLSTFNKNYSYGISLLLKLSNVFSKAMVIGFATWAFISLRKLASIGDSWKKFAFKRPDKYWRGMDKYTNRAPIFIIIFNFTMGTSTLIGFLFMGISSEVKPGEPNSYEAFIPFWRPMTPWANNVVFIICFMMRFLYILVVWFILQLFVMIAYLLKTEFDYCNQKLVAFIDKQRIYFSDRQTTADDDFGDIENSPYSSIEDARCEHDVLCHMTQMANDVFSPMVAICLCGAIIQICLVLAMVSGGVQDVNPNIILSLYTNSVAALAYLMVTLIGGVILNDKVSYI